MKPSRLRVQFPDLVALACAVTVFLAVALESPHGAGSAAALPGGALPVAVAPH